MADNSKLDELLQETGMQDKHLSAFDIYYKMGPTRTLKKLHAELQVLWSPEDAPTLLALQKWSTKFSWREISRQLDLEDFSVQRQEAQAELRRSAQARMAIARKMMDKGVTILDRADLDSLSPDDARELVNAAKGLIDSAVRIEKQEIAESIDGGASKPVGDMTDGELEEYINRLK